MGEGGRPGASPGLIHLLASLRHYESHLRPIFDALPPEHRGLSWSTRASDPWNTRHTKRDLPVRDELVMVASWVDYRRVAPRPVVLVEHGAGQAYGGDPASAGDPSYSGGRDRDRVVLFVVPNETVAERCQARQPDVPVAVVGCPRLDRFHAALTSTPDDGMVTEPGGRSGGSVSTPSGALCFAEHEPPTGRTDFPARSGVAQSAAHRAHNPEVVRSSRTPATKVTTSPSAPREPVVAFTFHWDAPLCPETRSAWPHYDRALPTVVEALRDRGIEVLGHGHPRMWRTLHRRWEQLGVESTPDVDEVLERASVLVADNTSLLWEAASLDTPLVILDVPWYRGSVDHGLRFWRHADAGVRIGDPADLVDAVGLALADPPEVAQRRREAAEATYAYRDGKAAQRAAEAILRRLRGRSETWDECPSA